MGHPPARDSERPQSWKRANSGPPAAGQLWASRRPHIRQRRADVGHLPTLVAIGFLLAEGKEVLGAFDGFADAAEQELEVFAALDEV